MKNQQQRQDNLINGKYNISQLPRFKTLFNKQIFFQSEIKQAILSQYINEKEYNQLFNSKIDRSLYFKQHSLKLIRQQSVDQCFSLSLASNQTCLKHKINNNNLNTLIQENKKPYERALIIFYIVIYLTLINFMISQKQFNNKIKISFYHNQNKFLVYKEKSQAQIDYHKIVDQILTFLNQKCGQMKAFKGDKQNYIIFNQNKQFIIGKGTFGKVYKGIMIKKNGIQKVAIKLFTLSEIQYQKQGYIIEFSREQSILKKITQSQNKNMIFSQNIVKFYDRYYEKQTNHTYIILQYCKGVHANKWIKQNESLQKKERKLFYLVKQISKTLYYLHFKCLSQTQKLKVTTIQDVRNIKKFEQTSKNQIKKPYKKPYSIGIIHRDIKPSNIIVQQLESDSDSQIKVKIIDFGLARASDVQNFVNFTQCGTMAFQALQVTRKRGYNATVDVYSLSVMILQMLSGKQINLLSSKEFENEILQKYQQEIIKQMNQSIQKSQNFKYFWRVFFEKCLSAQYSERWSSENLLSFILDYENNQIKNSNKVLNFYCLSDLKGVIFSQKEQKYYQIPLKNQSFLSQSIVCSEDNYIYINCKNETYPHEKIILKVVFNNIKNKISIQQKYNEKYMKQEKNNLQQKKQKQLNEKSISKNTIMYDPNTEENIYEKIQQSYIRKQNSMIMHFDKALYSRSNFQAKLFKVLIFKQQGKFSSLIKYFKQIKNNYEQQIFLLKVLTQLGSFILNDLYKQIQGVHGHIKNSSIIIKNSQNNKFQVKLINFEKFFLLKQDHWGLTCYCLQKQNKKDLIPKVLKHNRIKDLKSITQIAGFFALKQLNNYSNQKQIGFSTKQKLQIEQTNLKSFISYCLQQQKILSSQLVGNKEQQIVKRLQIVNKMYFQVLRYYQKLKNEQKKLLNAYEHNENIFLVLNLSIWVLQNLKGKGWSQFQVVKQKYCSIFQKVENMVRLFLSNNKKSYEQQNYQARLNEKLLSFKSYLINQQKTAIIQQINNIKTNTKLSFCNQQFIKIFNNILKFVSSLQQLEK